MLSENISHDQMRQVDYILSPCNFATHGLLAMLDDNSDVVVLNVENHADMNNLNVERDERVVAFVPTEPYGMLSTLRYLISLLNNSSEMFWLLIVSRIPSSWLWSVIMSQVTKGKLSRSAIHIAPSDLPCDKLSELLLPERKLCPYIKQVAMAENYFLGKYQDMPCKNKKDGLSKKEMQVMADSFYGSDITEQAASLGVSKKTLYNQRLSGIKKMAAVVPFLFSSIREKPDVATGDMIMLNKLSSFEREFAHALYCNELFVVFQPIIKDTNELQGFEILLRWYSKGQVLKPAEFLPKLHSTYVWIILTAFLIQKAVSYINLYEGKYFFSINIESSTIDNEGLMRMLNTAKKQLHSPEWVKQFVLEIGERNDLYQNEQSIRNLIHLQSQQFNIVLDDCFSANSVIFPVRKFQFNGYKIDMSIVNVLSQDEDALALVKSLSYYCKLTNRHCIAEGVDSIEKMKILRESGITYYQGHYISAPITADDLQDFIINFTA